MEIATSYGVKIRHYNSIFIPTMQAYREAVRFFMSVCREHWDELSAISNSQYRMRAVEKLTIRTKKNPWPACCFSDQNERFVKFPSYLRRAAIHAAAGAVSSWKSHVQNWEKENPKTRGARPRLCEGTAAVMPVLYHDNCYVRTGTYTARIKVYIRNTWDWLDVTLRKGDVDYIRRHFKNTAVSSPTLQRKGKEWFLRFACIGREALSEISVSDQKILAVDLGVNHACVCCAMTKEGTVHGRYFLSLPEEEDSLKKALGRIGKAQRRGARRMPALWARAYGLSRDIAVKTAAFIIEKAAEQNASVIVFEHLDVRGKKRGSRKRRLHHWRANYVQELVTSKAHRLRMRISRVCAWNTSRLAYDGSGPVERGVGGNYSICRFTSGRIYNCDLSAAYNIGARYFTREIIKSLPERERQRLEAKVPAAVKRSTCTLSTLYSLNAELAACSQLSEFGVKGGKAFPAA